MSVPSPFSKGAPPPPDYQGAADMMTRANRPNQSTPWASSSWSQGPGGQWSQNVGLNGPLAGLNDSLGSSAASAWGTPLSNGADARKSATDAMYGQATSRLDPMWAQRDHDQQVQLSQQGVDPNSAAYATSLKNQGMQRNDAYNQALYSAIMGGGQEAQRQQQMDLTSRMAPLQAISGLQGLTQMPGFAPSGDYLGAARSQGQYGLQSAQMGQDFWNDLISNGMKVFGAKK